MNDDYNFSREDAENLAGVTQVPHEMRMQALAMLYRNDPRKLAELFSNFIGMVNSVENNTRDFVIGYCASRADIHPHEAEKMNFPCAFGALLGAALAAGVDPKGTCEGCAFRLGTHANQSTSTVGEAEWCLNDHGGDGKSFWCHENMKDAETPNDKCRGYMKRLKELGDRVRRGLDIQNSSK